MSDSDAFCIIYLTSDVFANSIDSISKEFQLKNVFQLFHLNMFLPFTNEFELFKKLKTVIVPSVGEKIQ
jgi:hypothetical protein